MPRQDTRARQTGRHQESVVAHLGNNKKVKGSGSQTVGPDPKAGQRQCQNQEALL